jgi:hypothetical protein
MKRWFFGIVVALAGTFACSPDAVPSDPGSGEGGTGNAGTGNAGIGNAGTGNAGIGNAGTGNAGTGSVGTGAGGTDGPGIEPQDNPFCGASPSPADVLRAKCTTCHSDPPNSGAPFKLTTYADARAHAPGIAARVHAGTMPPPSANTPLTEDQKEVLLNWIRGGAQGGDCASEDACARDPNRCIGERFLPCTPDVRVLAFAPGDKAAKYSVPAGVSDWYNCFQVANPLYGTNKLVTAEAPVIDNSDVVHHWLLFGSMNGFDGQFDDTGGCVSPAFGDTLLSGWAPGGTNQVYPNDVGVRISQFPYLTLQVHYNNASAADSADASGIAYCSTTEQKPNVAGIVTLGTDLGVYIPPGASNYPGAVSTCNNLFNGSGTGTATIVTSAPHMHVLGAGFTTEHLRGGERIGYVSNVPIGTWRFDGQTHYAHSEVSPGGQRILVQPGDQLKTTCYYSNPHPVAVGFGGATTDEMCYDFLIAYPIDQLRRSCGPWISFLN